MKTTKKASFQQQVFKMIEQEIGINSVIAIPDSLLKFCGDLETGVFLSQLIYWCDKGKNKDGFIFKSYVEWHNETKLSEYKVKKSIHKLKGMNLLQTKLKQARGNPTIHYRLNRKAFIDAFHKFSGNETENIRNGNLKNSVSITDITAETSSEITEEYKGANEIRSIALSFKEYKKKYPINEETIEGIQYFLKKFKRHRFEEHPNLKPWQWDAVVKTLFLSYDENLQKFDDLDLDSLKAMINKYFIIEFQDGCNYSIIHFNNDGVKVRRMYEVAY